MNAISTTFEEFISAFNALDIERFAKCLASDVSLYSPSVFDAQLVEGSVAVEAHFRRVFQSETQGGPSIKPTEVRIRQLGQDAALLTFQFQREAGSIGKRSIAFERKAFCWKIVHIHATNTSAHERAA